jgi:4'-phosphopantetheinyl transferase
MAAVQIDPGKIYVTYASPADLEDAGSFAQAVITLSEDEICRAEAFHFERDRRLFVASRALVRRTLAQYVDVEPEALDFGTNQYGRPHVVFPPEGRVLRFSASRTDGLAMCAVAFDRDIGADVERLRACPLDVADSFAPPEARSIRECPESRRSESFFTYWTLKESYIKARGFGLSIPLDEFAFHLSEGQPPRLEVDPAKDRQAAGWRFSTLRPTAAHLAALCVYYPDQSTNGPHIAPSLQSVPTRPR